MNSKLILTEENKEKINMLAERIRAAGENIAKDSIAKSYYLETNRPDTIEIVSDSGYEAIIIGSTGSNSKGYMMLYTKNTSKKNSYPSSKKIAALLTKVIKKVKLPEGEGKASYMDWDEYGGLDKQIEHFSEIVCRVAGIE